MHFYLHFHSVKVLFMKTKVFYSRAMQICIAAFIMMFCIPINADAQFWKKWFRKKKKKEPIVQVVDTLPVVAVPDSTLAIDDIFAETNDSLLSANDDEQIIDSVDVDTVAVAVFEMPEAVKADEHAPFAAYSTVMVNDKTIDVNGVKFLMKCVQGGTFTMGKTIDQFGKSDVDEFPPHKVAVSTYYIGETEVTQALWEAVMGRNPSYYKKPNQPVESISWNDCQAFISKLNKLTGLKFRLPTEAEWEFAARGGNFSAQWHYAGEDNLNQVAWTAFTASSTKPVKQKRPNELGLYDMSGNVAEWCHDWYGEYQNAYQTNPTGPQSGNNKVVRGGHWIDGATSARVAYRYSLRPSHTNSNTGLRLVLNVTDEDVKQYQANNPVQGMRHFQQFNTEYLPDQSFKINDVEFKMVGVQGGSLDMGATLEQVRLADIDEQPCHNVAVSSFRIGQTEVTQALWKAVMGKNNNPSRFQGDDEPVENVSWNDCQEFIKKLNSITGLKFRLPTEAEWEYAARGGNISRQYTHPGSDNAIAVSWNARNSKKTMPVAILMPNELGIYDMGGNVAEWCEDWYASYLPTDMTNPQGPGRGSNKVIRGSFWEDNMKFCRPTYRGSKPINNKSYNLGFRLAL